MDKKILLGKRIKELRKKKGFTQEYLAEKLNIENRQLSKLETGKNYPSFETIEKLLKTFEITFEELTSVDHLQNKDNLKNLINDNIENMNEKQLLYVYKIIRCIIN